MENIGRFNGKDEVNTAKAKQRAEEQAKIRNEKRKIYNTIIIAVKKEMQKENISIDDAKAEEAIEKIIRTIFEKYQNIFENVTRARADILDEELIDYNGMIQEIVGFVMADGRLKIIKDDDGQERDE